MISVNYFSRRIDSLFLLPKRSTGGHMKHKITGTTRRELIRILTKRYQGSGKAEKGLMLDEFVTLTKYHRKHAVRLFNQKLAPSTNPTVPPSRKIYNEAVCEALTVIWEAADRICGKRLRVVMPDFVDSLQQHGHLSLDTELEGKLRAISAATIDRLLAPVRQKTRSRSNYRRNHKPYVKDDVPIRTFSDWTEPTPGYFEIDFVVHNGGVTTGSCVHTLAFTDVSSGWIECVALMSTGAISRCGSSPVGAAFASDPASWHRHR